MEFREIKKPSAKTENLVVQELADEFLIYDLDTHKAYNLNQTSSLIWQKCDGKKEIGEIAVEVGKELKQSVSEDFVWLALEGLKTEGLVSYKAETPRPLVGLNRREVIKRIGLASMVALPVITSLVAPTAAHAQSQLAPVVCGCCVKKIDYEKCGATACPAECETALGTCFGNSGCGGGILLTDVTCETCRTFGIDNPDANGQPKTVSWVVESRQGQCPGQQSC